MISYSPLILAKIDAHDTPQSVIIQHVVQLALSINAEVVLFRSIYKRSYEKDIYELSERQRKSETREVLEARSQLNRCADTLRKEGLDVECVVNWRMPFDMAFRHITEQLGPELILCERKPALGSDQIDPDDREWQLGLLTDLPVLYVDRPLPGPLTRTVWAAVDPMCSSDEHSRLNDRVIEQAKSAARLTGAEVHLVHCYSSALKLAETVIGVASAEYMPAPDAQENIRKRHYTKLAALADRHGITSQQIHNLPGIASIVLPALAAREQPDMVFAGTSNRGFISKILHGSTARKLLYKLPGRLCIIDLPKNSQQTDSERGRAGRAEIGTNDEETVLLTNMVRIARQTHLLVARQ